VGRVLCVAARAAGPAGAPALPAVHGGHCHEYDLGGLHSLVPCAFVHVLTIAELTALAEAQVGNVCPVLTGIVTPPLYWCSDHVPEVLLYGELSAVSCCSPLSDVGSGP